MIESDMAAPQSESTQANRARGIKLTVFALLGFMALVLGLFINKITTPRVLSPAELRINGAVVFDKPRIFKDPQLIDHRGQPFNLSRLQGKWTLIFFGFTHCPDVCPTALADLNKLLESLDNDIRADTQVVLVSVDPARDTEAVLANYVTYFNPEFIGVTGEFLQIKRFAGQLNVAFNKVSLGDTYTVDHSANIVLINPRGHYHGFFKPPLDINRMKLTFQSMVTAF